MNYKAFAGIGVNNSVTIVIIRTGLLLLLFFLLTSVEGYSQGKAITINGKNAVLYPSGKWELVKKSKIEPAESKDCDYAKNQVDNIKGTVIKVLQREKIISFTSEELKKIYGDRDYVTMDAYLSNFNSHIALFLKITILTNNPQPAYGAIYKDAKLIFKLNDGQTVTLHSGQSESGNVNYEYDKTTYMTFSN